MGIAELARRTGLSQQVLRAWETRFGFPTPERTEGGRRRYDERDVDLVRRVVALRETGVRLAAAVARVRAEDDGGHPRSVYAELLRRHPQLEARRLSRRVLVAISHAIEDEAMARAVRPHVFGAFQREEFYRSAAPRWQEIARTASSCLVYADFPGAAAAPGRPVEVPLEPDAPLLREWAVVVTAPDFSVVLTAWEVPGQAPAQARPGERTFESVFTFDPAAVRTAAEVCVEVARACGGVDPGLLTRLDRDLRAERTASAGVDAMVVRAFDYLQRLAR
jgi:DICT domain-containing protein